MRDSEKKESSNIQLHASFLLQPPFYRGPKLPFSCSNWNPNNPVTAANNLTTAIAAKLFYNKWGNHLLFLTNLQQQQPSTYPITPHIA